MGRGEGKAELNYQEEFKFSKEKKELSLILKDRMFRSATIAWIALTGSKAHGLDDEHSDTDYRGVYFADKNNLLGLDKPKEQLELKEHDIVIYEASKFFLLAGKGNPSVLEILYSPKLYSQPWADVMRKNSELFLSRKVKESFLGYSANTLKRISELDRRIASEEESKSLIRKRKKSARHLYRLGKQLEEALTTKKITPEVKDKKEIRTFEELSYKELQEYFKQHEEFINSIKTELPDEPDWNKLNELLVSLREESFKQKHCRY